MSQIDASAMDSFYAPTMERCANHPAVKAALAAGEMTPAAQAVIEAALVEAVKAAEQIKLRFLEDKKFQRAMTRFHFRRSYAAVKAQGAYRAAFEAAGAAICPGTIYSVGGQA